MEESLQELREALVHPFRSVKGTVSTAVIATFTYLVLMWGTYPAYFVDLVGANILYLDNAVITLTQYNITTTGLVGFGLTLLYAVLTGVLAVNIGSQLYVQGVSSLTGASAAVPGVLAAGCASCGVGLLGLFGFAGVLAMMPFQGNLIRLTGVLVIVYVLQRMGNPLTCRVESSLI